MSAQDIEHSDAPQLKFEFPDMQGWSRLRELILYISDRCAKDDKYGATKLNKILFFADFLSYKRYGVPITGMPYQRLKNGPAPVAIVPLTRQMEQDRDMVIRVSNYYGYPQKSVIALRDADLSMFSGEDIAIVDRVIDLLRDANATEVSNMSHNIAWRLAEDGERIPYNAAHLSNELLTERDIALTQEVMRDIEQFNLQNR